MKLNKRSLEYFPVQLFAVVMGLSGFVMSLFVLGFAFKIATVTIGLMNGYVMARLFSGTREGEIMEEVVKDIEDILGFLHFRFTIF